MSINNATPQDWDRLRKQAPAIDDSLMKRYLEEAEKEFQEQEEEIKPPCPMAFVPKRYEFFDAGVEEYMKSSGVETEEEDEEDMVGSPRHYNTGNIECIEAIEESMSSVAFKGYLKGNCMKYLWRYDYKGKQVEDLQKAQWYLQRLTNMVVFENE